MQSFLKLSFTMTDSTRAPSIADSVPPQTVDHHEVPAADSSKKPGSKSPIALFKSAVESYEEKRRAREAKRKVDFYEKLYGFVPKNAMTEAEWRAAREKMPKEKVKSSLRASRPYVSGGTDVIALAGASGGF